MIQQETRRAERRTAMAASTLRTDGRPPLDVVVLDVSETGVRILSDAALAVGQEISIGLAGFGATRAYVTWARDNQYGCAFEQSIGEEGAARAFSQGPIVRLGPSSAGTVEGEDRHLRELYEQHRFWDFPLDSIVALAGIIVLIVGGVWTWTH